MLAAVSMAAALDIHKRIIPNWLTLPLWPLGLILGAWVSGIEGFTAAVSACLLGLSVGVVFWLLGWFGGGDAKLVAAIGAIVGIHHIAVFLTAIAVAGGVTSVLVLLWQGGAGKAWQRWKATFYTSLAGRKLNYIGPDSQELQIRFPYAVPIAIGCLMAIGWIHGV